MLTTPPRAVLVVTPAAADPNAIVTLDATGSTDAEDASAVLEARFDFEGDGTWDTGFSTAKLVTRSWPTAGLKRLAVEVRDTSGASGYATGGALIRPASEAIIVTTAVDENNAGATPAAPGGAGLSLREAMTYSNGRAGRDVISFMGPMTINFGAAPPTLTDTAGVSIVGGPGVVLDGSGAGGNSTGLRASVPMLVTYLEIRGFTAAAIRFDGVNGEVAWCHIHDGGNLGVIVFGAGATIGPGNRIVNHSGEAVELHANTRVIDNDINQAQFGVGFYAGSSGSQAIRNRLWGGFRGFQIALNITDLVIWHNTVHGHSSGALVTSNGNARHDVRNNIFTSTGTYGVDASAAHFANFDFNDFFGVTTPCSCGAIGSGSSTLDPMYRSTAGADFRLLPASPVIDVGTTLATDANGPRPGNFNGTAPDMGAHEYP